MAGRRKSDISIGPGRCASVAANLITLLMACVVGIDGGTWGCMGGRSSEVEHAASVEQSTSTIGARILRVSLGFLESERLSAGRIIVQGIRLARWLV